MRAKFAAEPAGWQVSLAILLLMPLLVIEINRA